MVTVAEEATWTRALELAWEAFRGRTTPVGALAYAGADPYGGTAALRFGTPQARRRSLRVTGPLPDERGRLAELMHIIWLLQFPAGPHVMAAQQAALPALTALAARPATLRLFTEAAASQATLADLRTALRGTI